jgi:light-independent protochlorophyllide reductase subunit L
MEPTPALQQVLDSYLSLAERLWEGTPALDAMPMKDREIFDFLGFD